MPPREKKRPPVPVTKALVEALEARYQNRSLTAADLGKSDRDIWFRAGQVSVVVFLRNLLDNPEQNEEDD